MAKGAKRLPLTIQTIYAELLDQCEANRFDTDFPIGRGGFVVSERNGRRYWYFQLNEKGKRTRRYVGPETPDLVDRIARHEQRRAGAGDRREMVQTLKRSRLPAPDRETGKLIETMAEASVFRLRAVLIGTLAYQTYGPMLGVRLPLGATRTHDIDISQAPDVSVMIEDELDKPLLDVLHGVDDSFRPVSPPLAENRATSYIAASGMRVDLIATHRGPESDLPVRLPALGTDAQPLRFLDFLIYDAIAAVVLYGAGILVSVPAPERYALHKLLVARRRTSGHPKIEKDMAEAASLIEVLADARPDDLAQCWKEMRARGSKWRKYADEATRLLPPHAREKLDSTIRSGAD